MQLVEIQIIQLLPKICLFSRLRFKVCQSTLWRESGCDEKHGCYETKEVTVLLGSEK